MFCLRGCRGNPFFAYSMRVEKDCNKTPDPLRLSLFFMAGKAQYQKQFLVFMGVWRLWIVDKRVARIKTPVNPSVPMMRRILNDFF